MNQHNQLSRDDKKLILSAVLLLFFLIVFGSLSLWYQIQRFKRVRTRHASSNTNQTSISNDRRCVHQLQKSAAETRKEMQDRMEKEVETLRVFQEELRGQVDMLKVAFAKKAREGTDNAAVEDRVQKKDL